MALFGYYFQFRKTYIYDAFANYSGTQQHGKVAADFVLHWT